MDIEKAKNYVNMQLHYYTFEYEPWSVSNRNPVVGTFDEHNKWKNYDTCLWRDVEFETHRSCLDYGCGPARNIVRFNAYFDKFDGVDLCPRAIDNARRWIDVNGCDQKKTSLYLNNGYDLAEIPDNSYDIVMSTIVLQHICVHEIRFNLLKEFFRVLKPGGMITHQMLYGDRRNTFGYFENIYQAMTTNGTADVRVNDPKEIETDLTAIGYENFNHYITEKGPGDYAQHWIFFNATKPAIGSEQLQTLQ